MSRRPHIHPLLPIAALALAAGCAAPDAKPPEWILVNDVHSQLNLTLVDRIVRPQSIADVQAAIAAARREGRPVSIAGGRHAMGGQQFGTDSLLLDMSSMNRVLSFDPEKGFIEAEAGIQWPELMEYLARVQRGRRHAWGILQKQTGANDFSLGGSLSANIHGRVLAHPPLIADVESFVLVDGEGHPRICNRFENAELFRLASGGYGLFGVITSVKLRLTPRVKMRRLVERAETATLMERFDHRIAEGCRYGDFQFSIDEQSEGFMRDGILACYQPVPSDTPVPEGQKMLTEKDWKELYTLAHRDRRLVFEKYVGHYLATDGQVYWSDTHQLSDYWPGYHAEVDRRLGAPVTATEMITELYVPRSELRAFMEDARRDFLEHGATVIYGTVRLIEPDTETFLAWAREPFACIVFNLHVEHTPEGIEKAKADFRRLIDRALERRGSFFLTYHRWATRSQVEQAYPQFVEFLRLKKKYDPQEVFQSTWYRHYKSLFANPL
jgi:FAD/FMN-containing dehydrogenase